MRDYFSSMAKMFAAMSWGAGWIAAMAWLDGSSVTRREVCGCNSLAWIGFAGLIGIILWASDEEEQP